jgi:DnaK suppressor protein
VQLDFFRALLLDLKRQTSEHIETIKQEIASPATEADELDRALLEEENRQRMRIAEREYYLLRKIDKALDRIERGEYGYCEASGMEIGLQRLLARPTTEYSAEEKARQEQLERNYTKLRT